MSTNLVFYTEDLDLEESADEHGCVVLSLYLISDSYIGLDQQV
eukprot:SAG11_NODE_1965_length_3989_cov_2.106684_1_plen_42_part_10